RVPGARRAARPARAGAPGANEGQALEGRTAEIGGLGPARGPATGPSRRKRRADDLLGSSQVAPSVPIGPTDALARGGQRAGPDDREQELQPAITDDEASTELQPHLGLHGGGHYVPTNTLNGQTRADRIGPRHGAV